MSILELVMVMPAMMWMMMMVPCGDAIPLSRDYRGEDNLMWSGCEDAIPPPCASHCTIPTQPGTSYNVLQPDGSLQPVPVEVHYCVIGATEQVCSLDIDNLVGDLWQSVNQTTQLYAVVGCTKPTRIVFTKGTQRTNDHLFAVLQVRICAIYSKELSFFGEAVDLRVLMSTNTVDEFQEGKEDEYYTNCTSYSTDEDLITEALQRGLRPPLKGLESVGTLLVNDDIAQLSNNQSVERTFLSAFVRQHYWPSMAEIHIIHKGMTKADAQSFVNTMPKLQSLELTDTDLKEPMNFPWQERYLNLPLSLVRTPNFNHHYTTLTGITLEPDLYRRIHTVEDNPGLIIVNTTFSGIMQRIVIKNCEIAEIHPLAFANVSELESLDMSQNRLTHIPPTIFPKQGSLLKMINFAENDLLALVGQQFDSVLSLTHIFLAGNSLTSIGSNVFSGLSKLVELDLSMNKLVDVDSDIFSSATLSIGDVNFQSNDIEFVPYSVFYIRELKSINFADNHITFDSFIQVLSEIDAELLLRANTPSSSSMVDPYRPTMYKTIDLSRNYLTDFNYTMDERTRKAFNLILNFYNMELEGNEIDCDCGLYELHLYFKEHQAIEEPGYDKPTVLPSYFADFRCYYPSEVRGDQLVSVPNTTFSCPLEVIHCPHTCVCRERSVDALIIVDCRSVNMTTIPLAIPKMTTSLLLSGNMLTSISHALPSYLNQLTLLDLSNNQLDSIHQDFFHSLTQLSNLYLHRNQLQRLPESVQALPGFTHLTLADNRFVCDCESIWFQSFLRESHKRIDDVDSILCSTGKPQGDLLIYANTEDFICETSEKIARIAIGVVVPFFLVVIISLVAVYKYRGEIKLFMYIRFRWHPFDQSDDTDILDKQYDAFVSYNHSDHPWILNQLRARLEDDDPKFRLCIHDRDFAIGEAITLNIANSVAKSRRTILVLSKRFLQSEWCTYEFRAAHHKVLKDRSNYLIIIVLEELNLDDLDEDMQLYMRTNTYLALDNRWFWQKLLYAMPQTPLSQLQASATDQSDSGSGGNSASGGNRGARPKKVKCNSDYASGAVSSTGRRLYVSDAPAGPPTSGPQHQLNDTRL